MHNAFKRTFGYDMKHVIIYCDGACSKNPGPGGWACVLNYKGNKKELSGFVEESTNNRMELTAVMQGLLALNESCNVSIFTDSAYIHNAFDKGWIISWQNNGWRRADKKPVENKDLWQHILNLSKNHRVTWHKVMGHSNDETNNHCDKLARGQIRKHMKNVSSPQQA